MYIRFRDFTYNVKNRSVHGGMHWVIGNQIIVKRNVIYIGVLKTLITSPELMLRSHQKALNYTP
jgi:hypothetical protein